MSDDKIFPHYEGEGSRSFIPKSLHASGGLSKRELFAALAMQSMDLKDRGCWSENDIKRGDHLAHPNWVAKAAVDYADALILALKGKR